MTHLVAYGTPPLAGPDIAILNQMAKERDEAKRRWPAKVVALTEAGRFLCGAENDRTGAVSLYDYADRTPRSEICPACIEAASLAGKPLPPEDGCE